MELQREAHLEAAASCSLRITGWCQRRPLRTPPADAWSRWSQPEGGGRKRIWDVCARKAFLLRITKNVREGPPLPTNTHDSESVTSASTKQSVRPERPTRKRIIVVTRADCSHRYLADIRSHLNIFHRVLVRRRSSCPDLADQRYRSEHPHPARQRTGTHGRARKRTGRRADSRDRRVRRERGKAWVEGARDRKRHAQ